MPRTDQRPIQIAFDTAGTEGSPVLLVMGYCVPGKGWVNQVRDLSLHHRVAWFDNRGIGRSDRPPGPYTMADMAADAVAVMDQLGWQEAHLVGVSMGGMIAQHVALTYRHRLLSLSLLATHAGGFVSRMPTLRGLRHFIGGMFSKTTDDRLASLERLLSPPDWLAGSDRDAVRQALIEQFGDPVPQRTRTAQLAAVSGHHTRDRLHRLADLPTLIIQPTDDLLVRPAESERLLGLIPNATLLRLDATGHGLIRQRPREINLALLEHFTDAEAGARVR